MANPLRRDFNGPTIENFVNAEQAHLPSVRLAQITFGDEGTDELAEALIGPLDDHAGNTEVSITLAAHPDLTERQVKGT